MARFAKVGENDRSFPDGRLAWERMGHRAVRFGWLRRPLVWVGLGSLLVGCTLLGLELVAIGQR